ncbi:MAG: hypothetical protein RLZ97_1904 [Verrucomicrobiota bacterium]|jgi:hypothetical protein
MTPTKESIKAWLDSFPDRDRHWLAQKCEVEKKTVDNWLSSPREIPAKALLIIEGLMRADLEIDRAKQPAPLACLVLEVPVATFDAYNRAATERGLLIREWAVQILNESARRDAEAKYQANRLRVAEDEPKEKPGA